MQNIDEETRYFDRIPQDKRKLWIIISLNFVKS